MRNFYFTYLDMINLTDALTNISRDNDWDDILIGAKILNLWPKLFAAQSGNIASVNKFENGTLYLKARSSSWKTEIRLRSEELIDQLNFGLGRKCVLKIEIRN